MLSKDFSLISVEKFALEYYATEEWKGFHSENSIIMTLFGLLFWDAIFDSTVPGAFNSPFQIAPFDLRTEYFYESRKAVIESILDSIRQGFAAELIIHVCKRERTKKTTCVGVSWSRFKDSELVEIVQCIGGEPLAKICKAFAKTFWAHLGGVPDLCLWKPSTREFKLVEVKSENDRLSYSQQEWLQHLKAWGISTETVHIKYPKTITYCEYLGQLTKTEI